MFGKKNLVSEYLSDPLFVCTNVCTIACILYQVCSEFAFAVSTCRCASTVKIGSHVSSVHSCVIQASKHCF